MQKNCSSYSKPIGVTDNIFFGVEVIVVHNTIIYNKLPRSNNTNICKQTENTQAIHCMEKSIAQNQ